MIQVALRGMKFYGFHGYYSFERRVGNSFTMDIVVDLKGASDPKDRIEHTINYEELYEIAKSYMQAQYLLLESLAYDIAQEITTR